MTTLYNKYGEFFTPGRFIDIDNHLPATGRGAWNKRGIDFSWRYELNPDGTIRLGTQVERGLDYWAVAAGCWAIQRRLIDLGFLAPIGYVNRGVFNETTKAAVIEFQRALGLEADGTVGTGDTKALFTPLIDAAEVQYHIPYHYLRGEINHESLVDPGAVGSEIYYPEYRGVDRGLVMNNSLANDDTWMAAFNPNPMIPWAAKKWHDHFNDYKTTYPGHATSVYEDAAICAHNSPVWGRQWAQLGHAPNAKAQEYVDGVKGAIY